MSDVCQVQLLCKQRYLSIFHILKLFALSLLQIYCFSFCYKFHEKTPSECLMFRCQP